MGTRFVTISQQCNVMSHTTSLETPTDVTDDVTQWTLEKLQAYIVHVKTINPVTTETANQLALYLAPPL